MFGRADRPVVAGIGIKHRQALNGRFFFSILAEPPETLRLMTPPIDMITTNTVVVIVFKEGDPLTLEYPAVVIWVLPDGVAWM